MDNIRIETDRLILRYFTADDAEDSFAMLSREEVVKNVNSEVQTLEQVRENMTRTQERYKLNTCERLVKLSLAVEARTGGRVIGWVGLAPPEFDPADIEIYYGFHPDYWGKGYATEAATAMLHYGFMVLKLPRIVGLTLPHNKPSSRVLEKIGLIYRWTIANLPEEHSYFEGCNYFSLSRNDYIDTTMKQEDSTK